MDGAICAAQGGQGVGKVGDDDGGGGAQIEEAEDHAHGERDIGQRLKGFERDIGAVVLEHQARRRAAGRWGTGCVAGMARRMAARQRTMPWRVPCMSSQSA